MGERTWRVKLYTLAGDGRWEDCGIGYTTLISSRLAVESEEDPEIHLLEHIIGDEMYRLQSDTIMTWTDLDSNTFALSFQDPNGAHALWEEVCVVQGRDPGSRSEYEFQLPDPTPNNLQNILTTFHELPITSKESFISHILASHFIPSLASEFLKSEEQQNIESILLYSQIFKSLIHLMNHAVTEDLLSDQAYMSLIGALEYDTSTKLKKIDLRSAFPIGKEFNNVLGITDKDFLDKVKLSSRLQYLKDSVVIKSLDEEICMYLMGYLLIKMKDIIMHFCNSGEIRSRLIEGYKKNDMNMLNFLNDLFSVSKLVPLTHRWKLYETLFEDGILDILEGLWNDQTEPDKLKLVQNLTLELLINMLMVTSETIKRFLLANQEKDPNLLSKIAKAMIQSSDINIQQQVSEFIRILIEPGDDQRYYPLIDSVYDKVLTLFLEKMDLDTGSLEESKFCLLEILNILSQCIDTHTYRIRYFLIYNGVVQKTLRLLEFGDKSLQLVVIRFLRSMLAKNDQVLNSYLTNHNCFYQVFKVFKANGSSQNMIFSAVLSMLEVLKKQKPRIILEHIVSYIQVDNVLEDFQGSQLYKYLEPLKNILDAINEPVNIKKSSSFSLAAEEELNDIPEELAVKRARGSSDEEEEGVKKLKVD